MKYSTVSLFLSIFVVNLTLIDSKVFTRCQLTRELLRNNFSRTFISNWVCLIEQSSDRNTSYFSERNSKKKFYGLFAIGSEWCKEGRKGGKCNVSCESLIDDDIRDDIDCANQVFESEGFKYWSKWLTRCKGQALPDVDRCPDWRFPPNRSSPSRERRRTRNADEQKNIDEKVVE